MADEIENSEEIKEVKKNPLIAGIKRWFYIGAWSAAGLAGFFGGKKLNHLHEDSPEESHSINNPGSRAPSSVISPNTPGGYPSWDIPTRLVALELIVKEKSEADSIEHRESREERRLLRTEANTQNQQFGERLGRVENSVAEIRRDVKDLLNIVRSSPKMRADIRAVNPEERAN